MEGRLQQQSLLQISPKGLVFDFKPNRDMHSHIALRNATQKPVVFKIKISNSEAYLVKPPSGIVEAGAASFVKIVRQGAKTHEEAKKWTREKLAVLSQLVDWTTSDGGQTLRVDFDKRLVHQQEVIKIKVKKPVFSVGEDALKLAEKAEDAVRENLIIEGPERQADLLTSFSFLLLSKGIISQRQLASCKELVKQVSDAKSLQEFYQQRVLEEHKRCSKRSSKKKKAGRSLSNSKKLLKLAVKQTSAALEQKEEKAVPVPALEIPLHPLENPLSNCLNSKNSESGSADTMRTVNINHAASSSTMDTYSSLTSYTESEGSSAPMDGTKTEDATAAKKTLVNHQISLPTVPCHAVKDDFDEGSLITSRTHQSPDHSRASPEVIEFEMSLPVSTRNHFIPSAADENGEPVPELDGKSDAQHSRQVSSLPSTRSEVSSATDFDSDYSSMQHSEGSAHSRQNSSDSLCADNSKTCVFDQLADPVEQVGDQSTLVSDEFILGNEVNNCASDNSDSDSEGVPNFFRTLKKFQESGGTSPVCFKVSKNSWYRGFAKIESDAN